MHGQLTLTKRRIQWPGRMALMLALLIIGSMTALAQAATGNLAVTGMVLDEEGEPVIGATIRVKESGFAVVTDIDGRYNIRADKGNTIMASYIGCLPEEAVVADATTIDFTLRTDNKLLDEVVVVGYGIVKKKDLTGSVSSLKGDIVTDRRTTQLSNALQGTMAGVQVSRNSGQPGTGASDILIRGVTTIKDSSPLIIVDGVPVDNINDVNAADVENISVLKDAASSAIYGARAASGVILITTRRADENNARVTYNFEYGLEIRGAQPRQVDFQRYLEMVNELRYNDNPDGGWFQEYSEDQVQNWVARNPEDPDNYPITDWLDLLTKKTAPRQTHVLSFSGGTQKIKARSTISFDKVDGLFREVTSDYQRLMARVNTDYNINKWVSAHLDLNVNYNETNRPQFSSVWSAIFNYSPAWAHRWSNGGMGDVKNGSNPYGRLVDGGTRRTRTTKVGGKASIDIKPIDGLLISAVMAPNITYTSPKEFSKTVGYNGMDDPLTILGYLADHDFTSLTEERNLARSMTWQAFANYTKDFGKHGINVMLGYETYLYHHESLKAETSHFDLDDFPYLSAGNREYDKVGGSAYENAYRSFFGRAMYNFDDRYLVQVNFRRDGSSRFASKYRWGNFPSVSLGWVLSQEKFMDSVNKHTLSFLKLRGSWGRLGNERIGNYPYIALVDMTNSLFYTSPDATEPTYYKGAAQIQYAINNITWETTESWDIGLDARFFDNRLSFTGDYYRKTTKDMLLELEIPKYVGYSNPSQNAGRMYTEGYDLELSWNDRIDKVSYSVGVNFSDYISKMSDMKGRKEFIGSTAERINQDGSYFQEWYGYIADGIFQTEEELAGAPVLNSTTTVGDIRYKDISGPDGTPDGIISEYDRVCLGNSLPRYQFGGNIQVFWNGFDFNAAFQGVGSQNVRMTEAMTQPFKNNWGAIPGNLDGNYWSSLNTAEQNAEAYYPRLTYVNRNSNNAMSTYWIFNGRYFRMKNLTLGYTLPQELTRKAYIDKLRFYVSANDLFCFHNYPTGYDPERTTSQYPLTKQVLFGLNINF